MPVFKFYIVTTTYRESEDAEVQHLFDENGKLIMEGDWYHDKIDHMIEGFFEGFTHSGLQYTVNKTGYFSEE